MRILLVTLSDILPFALTQVLNPANEYCAIVVDEPDISKKMFKDYPQITNVIFPFYELKECIENLHYDLTVCFSGGALSWEVLPNELKKYGLSDNKLIAFHDMGSPTYFMIERAMRYYKNHMSDFDVFSTGISYTELGLIPEAFLPNYRLFNFARASSDLYYDYQIAKYILEVCRGGVY